MIGTIRLCDPEDCSKDFVGCGYEGFLAPFASDDEGRSGRQFDALRCVIGVLAEMFVSCVGKRAILVAVRPAMFVPREQFVEVRGGIVVWRRRHSAHAPRSSLQAAPISATRRCQEHPHRSVSGERSTDSGDTREWNSRLFFSVIDAKDITF